MNIKRFLNILVISVLLVAGLAVSPAVPGQVQVALAASVTYNLYATDGYVEMADGAFVYNYGFVGGRAGVDFTYQTSPCTFDLSRGTRVCGGSSNVTVPGGSPAPTGGPRTGLDAQLAGNAQFPAPLIYATKGDVVEIRLKNLGVQAKADAPNDPHSIHLHGLDVNAANDGVPETSVGAVPANLCVDGSSADDCSAVGGSAPGAGNVIVYMFSPTIAGTYFYHCHQEADIHVNMGMYGALVVYNPGDDAAATGPGQDRGGNLFGFQYDKDYVLLLSEIDIRGHADEEGTYVANSWDPDPWNWAQYKPQYWFINGLSFPVTIHAGFPSGYAFTDWLLAHPGYDPLITGSVSMQNPYWKTKGQKVLIRMINMGFETQPMHMHGFHGKVLGSDQRGWTWANRPRTGNVPPTPFNSGLEKQTITIGSGETYEWLVDFGQQAFASTYAAGMQTRYDPATNLPVANTQPGSPIPLDGDPASGLTYIGGPTVTGTVLGDPAGTGGQYFPFHNHDDYKATNNGVYPGGMFTMLLPLP